MLIRTNCDLCFQRESDRNADWAHCIFLGAACDKRDIFATREVGESQEPELAEDGRGIFSQKKL